MADPTVRAMAFYWRDKKAIYVNKTKIQFMMGREQLVGQEGILAFSKGLASMKATVSGFTPVGGSHSTDDIERILTMTDIDFSVVLGGKYFREKAAVTEVGYDGDSEKGTTVEELTFIAKRPQITG